MVNIDNFAMRVLARATGLRDRVDASAEPPSIDTALNRKF